MTIGYVAPFGTTPHVASDTTYTEGGATYVVTYGAGGLTVTQRDDWGRWLDTCQLGAATRPIFGLLWEPPYPESGR